MMRTLCRGLVLSQFLLLFAFSADAAIMGRASVIDGDTIEIHGQRIRLYGIDAPESAQTCLMNRRPYRCGKDAAFALADHIGSSPLRCEARGHDRYRRVIAVCFLRDEDVNAWMVRHGYALAYRKYANNYVADEDRARSANLGVWRGDFTPPWEWRRETHH
jgi:endonuclease YncB( thermonuclease family)